MNASIIIALINNAALLLALGLLYDTLASSRSEMGARLQQALTGIILGGMGIAVMLTPWTMIPGLVFDTRTVLLSLSGLFFGGLPTLVAMLVTGIYRLTRGGAGVWMGVATIVTSGLIGIAWRRLRRKGLEHISPGELYAFGIVVHVDMLLCTFLLPSLDLALDTLSKISLPVMAIYPVEVMLLGLLLSSRLRRKQTEQALRDIIEQSKRDQAALVESQKRLVQIVDFLPDALFAVDKEQRIIIWNRAVEKLTGVPASEMLGRGDYEYARPIYGEARPLLVDMLWEEQSVIEKKYYGIDRQGETLVAEVTVPLLNDGKGAYLWGKAAPLRDREGNIIGAIETLRDITERKRVENNLKQSEEKFRGLFENAVMGIFNTAPDGQLLAANQAFAEIYGYSNPQEMLSQVNNVGQQLYVHPEDHHEVLESLSKKGSFGPREYLMKRRDGKPIWVTITAREVRDASGNLLYIEGTNLDISDRKQAEERLRLQGLVLEQIQDNVTITDLEGRITYVNDAECRLLKRSREELLGQPVMVFGEDPSRGSTQAELLSTVLLNGEWRGDIVNYASDGSEIILDSRVQMVYDLEGKPLVLCGISTDITERVRAEQRLAASEAELRALFTVMQDLVLTLDKDGIYRKIAPTSQSLLVRPAEELLGRSIREFFPAEQAERFIECIRQALTTQGPARLEYPLKIGEQPYWFSAVISPLTEDTAVCVIRDITESKQVEEQIKESLREKEALLRELYHRTKNNMQVIRSMLVLQSADTQNEEVKRLVQETNNKIQAMALVHQMLYQSKNLTSIALENYIQDLAYYAFSSYRLEPNQIDLQLNLQSMLVTIEIAIPLGLILNELLSNAFKHAFPDGRRGVIRLDLSRIGDHTIWLQFSDDGVGIPPGFDLRNQKSYGLQSVFSIAEYQLGGQVEIDNRQGLTYSIKFSDESYE